MARPNSMWHGPWAHATGQRADNSGDTWRPEHNRALNIHHTMKIVYLCFEDFSVETGVAKKICSQAHHWQKVGHDVFLVAPEMKGARMAAAEGLELVEFSYPLGSRKYMVPDGLGIKEIRRIQPDVIYNRYFILPPWHLSLARESALVFEVNSEESEFALYHSRLKRMLHQTWRKRFLQSAAGAVFISQELSEKSEYTLFRNRVVIANGVARGEPVDGYVREPGPPRLFFIGNGNFSWHGVDKICQLAEKLPHVSVDIVGDPELPVSLPNVTSHGPLPREDYLPLLLRADVAIGPLSLHSKDLTEASPLKVREYLSCGIPTIFAYRDTDVSESTPLTLHLPNTADNVVTNIERIEAFIHDAVGKRVAWDDVSSIDATVKEQRRLDFFTRCAETPARAAA